MSDRATVDFLAAVPLLEGRGEADLVELARVLRRRSVGEGEILWRQGDDARLSSPSRVLTSSNWRFPRLR